MTYGLIYVAYNTADLIDSSLRPWIEARMDKLNGHTILICAVNVPFTGFPNEGHDETRDILKDAWADGEIDNLITGDEPISETEARTKALTWLRGNGADIVVQWDSDEIATTEQLSRIMGFVEANPFIVWFRLSLKNYVFDDKTYLVEPFTPPRIHRVRPKVGVLTFDASCFVQDNDIAYSGGLTRDLKRQEQFASMTIPPSCAFVAHYSWPNSPRSKSKIAYQAARQWPSCSFAWDDSKGGLIFNEAHYVRLGQALPEVAHD